MKIVSIIVLIVCFPFNVSAQTVDSVQTFRNKSIKPFIIPAVFIGYGIIAKSDNTLNRFDRYVQHHIHTNNLNPSEIPEDVLRYVPAVTVYGLNLAGLKGTNRLVDASGIFLLSNVIMGVSVRTTKQLTQHNRPDGSDNHSFPSGHSGSAFASAEFLKQEYKNVSPLYGYAGYTIATATGLLRIRHNKHWFGDIVAGAGFGILSTKAAYLLYPEIKKLFLSKKDMAYSMVPAYHQRTIGLNFTASF